MFVALVTVSPHFVQQIRPAKYATWIAREIIKEVEFSCRQLDLPASKHHLSTARKNAQATRANRLLRFCLHSRCLLHYFHTPENCSHARDKFQHTKRLGQVIICAGFQAENSIKLG